MAIEFYPSKVRESLLRNLLDRFVKDFPFGEEQIRAWLSEVLGHVRQALDLGWIVTYSSPRPFVGTVPHLLEPLAQSGLTDNEWQGIIHFNWRKAQLLDPEVPKAMISVSEGIVLTDEAGHKWLERSARGLPPRIYAAASLLVPVYLSPTYRGVALFGGEHEADLSQHDRDFLTRLGHRILISTLTRMAGQDLNVLHEEWATMRSVLVHEYRASLSRLPDAIAKVVSFLERADSPYDRSQALEAARSIESIAYKVSQRSQSLRTAEIERNLSKGSLVPAEHSLLELVQTCVKAHVSDARARNVNIYVDSSLGSAPMISVNRQAFLTVLSQILDNAIKYSHEGKFVKITGAVLGDVFTVAVEDFGLGIDPSEDTEIYRLERQGRRSSRAEQEPGQGVGLYVADKLARAMGGRVFHGVSSGPRDSRSKALDGYWVRFTVELPFANKGASAR